MKEHASIAGSHPSQRIALYKDERGQKIGIGLFDPLQGQKVVVGLSKLQMEQFLADLLGLYEDLWQTPYKRETAACDS
jgi:hypothetical protein